LLWCATVILYAASGLAAEVPPLQGQINDYAGVVSAPTKQSLTRKLVAYEQTTGHQLAVLTVPTLGGDPVEDFSIRVVETWNLGKKGTDDGILLLVATADHKVRIEVGYGLEGSLPDAVSGRIIRELIAPNFRRGDYDSGITSAIDAILARTGGESLIDKNSEPVANANRVVRVQRPAPHGLLGWIGFGLALLFRIAFFGIFVVVVVILVVVNLLSGGRPRGFYVGGGFGGGGGGFGGDDRGGGFSGGGGGFGGGGASGDW
jgi:uncharacterized protein